jgi:hypothetical protein
MIDGLLNKKIPLGMIYFLEKKIEHKKQNPVRGDI